MELGTASLQVVAPTLLLSFCSSNLADSLTRPLHVLPIHDVPYLRRPLLIVRDFNSHHVATRAPEIGALLGDPDRALNEFGFTRCHLGAMAGDTSYLTRLLLEGASAVAQVSAIDGYGRTPIAYAAILGSTNACRFLLE